MEALDGNSIAGALFEYFGAEMTTAPGTCAHCGRGSLMAELRVYSRAPGAVVRCPHCGNVVGVVLTIGGSNRVELDHYHLLHPPAATTQA